MVLKLPIYLHGSQVTNVPPAVLLRKKTQGYLNEVQNIMVYLLNDNFP